MSPASTVSAVSGPYLLSQLVVAGAERDPGASAVRSGDEELTYGELAARTEALAATLQGLGVRPGDRVGLYLHKSVAAFVAIHGVLRAGAAYVPIDPFAPPGLVADITADCGIEVLVSESRQRRNLTNLAARPDGAEPLRAVVGLDGPLDGLETVGPDTVAGASGGLVAPRVLSDDIAYVMYTSGSTGRPKGIVHTHRSGLRYAQQAVEVYGVRPSDRLANSAPFHFDISTFEVLAGPLAGASTLVIPEPYLKMPASLSQLLADDRSTFWYSVPFLLAELWARGALAERDLSGLRWVLFGGEVMAPDVLAGLMGLWPGARFSNSYGPAEVNQCTFHHVAEVPAAGEGVPIGRPLPDVDLLVVDPDAEPGEPLTQAASAGAVADGEVGQLLVRCSTMMDRYWARDDLTTRAFVHLPLPGGGLARWYATGDLVRRRPDGELEFVGRRDNQVKVRGNRVELESVEAVLAAQPGVEHAVAGVVDADGNQVLAAAVVPSGDEPVDTAALLAAASAALPPYAVPHRLVTVEDLPFTASGKLDRRALRARLAERLDTTGAHP
ncbi:MAG: amino acid adenylation domain-containing protein [Actinomycetota bacterium]|nr:amino acid adenylation domain-containing protein [Actinomycetota bacterium]